MRAPSWRTELDGFGGCRCQQLQREQTLRIEGGGGGGRPGEQVAAPAAGEWRRNREEAAELEEESAVERPQWEQARRDFGVPAKVRSLILFFFSLC